MNPGSDNNLGSPSAQLNKSRAIQLRRKNNHGNHYNPINHSSASAQFNESAAIQLRQKNHGNLFNPMNPGRLFFVTLSIMRPLLCDRMFFSLTALAALKN